MLVIIVDIILRTSGRFFKLNVNFYDKFTFSTCEVLGLMGNYQVTPKMKIQSVCK